MMVVLIIEEDTLLREALREQLERDEFEVCAAANLRAAQTMAQLRAPLLVLCSLELSRHNGETLHWLRTMKVPVGLLRRSATVPPNEQDFPCHLWSPYSADPLRSALRALLPQHLQRSISRSGTYSIPTADPTVTKEPAVLSSGTPPSGSSLVALEALLLAGQKTHK